MKLYKYWYVILNIQIINFMAYYLACCVTEMCAACMVYQTTVVRLLTPRLSPRHNHKFHGERFSWGGDMEHPWWLLLSGYRYVAEATDEQTDR